MKMVEEMYFSTGSTTDQVPEFKITDTELYVTVIILSLGIM